MKLFILVSVILFLIKNNIILSKKHSVKMKLFVFMKMTCHVCENETLLSCKYNIILIKKRIILYEELFL